MFSLLEYLLYSLKYYTVYGTISLLHPRHVSVRLGKGHCNGTVDCVVCQYRLIRKIIGRRRHR